MERELVAEVQYGDMRGTIAVDGFHGLNPHTVGLSADTNGRAAIGISLYLSPGGSGELQVSGNLIVVNEELSQHTADEIRNHAVKAGKLRVKAVPAKVDVEKLLESVKRLNIVLALKSLEGIELVIEE